jgi:hypothetical protein
MLRASAEATGTAIDYRGIVDESVDPRLPWGVELRDVATALTHGKDLAEARAALVDAAGAGPAAAAVGVCANFQMMNRVLDATGCPVPAHARSVAKLVGVDVDH